MYADSNSPHHMTILNLDNSWKLLCEKVFRPEHDHPLELEEIGKEIARKCQGLPEDFQLDKTQSTLKCFSNSNKLPNLYWQPLSTKSDSFPNLKRLVLKKCKCLPEIPIDFGEICTLESIELHECSRAAEDFARKK
ncbi:hypothetical protein MTR67_021803 [Solanum verrucosum]|uniref:Uncharacterized protein n=1 Tax=Solanum verrucosum TaxID=315347 RepID=A0AAF0TX71_SOLVR|nr:hypothetical protein MTR67_021803 [Solanum verrucosum]